jgi:hypothetical protein
LPAGISEEHCPACRLKQSQEAGDVSARPPAPSSAFGWVAAGCLVLALLGFALLAMQETANITPGQEMMAPDATPFILVGCGLGLALIFGVMSRQGKLGRTVTFVTGALLAISIIGMPSLQQHQEAKAATAQRQIVAKVNETLRLAQAKAKAAEEQQLAEDKAKADEEKLIADEKARAAEEQRLAKVDAIEKRLAEIEELLRAEQAARAGQFQPNGPIAQPNFQPNGQFAQANPAPGPQVIGVLEDNAGKDHGAIYGGVTVEPGRVGQTLQFNGQDSQIDFGATAGNVGANDFTIAWWMNTSSTPPGGIQSFLAKRADCDAVNSLDITIGGGEPVGPGRVQLGLQDGIHGANNLNTTNTLNDGQWHHVVWVRQADAGKATATEKVYVDGKLNNATTDALVFNISNAAHLVMGTDVCVGRNGTVPYRGAADGLEFWDRALTADEITRNYQSGLVGKVIVDNSLIHSWSGQNVALSKTKLSNIAPNPAGQLPTSIGASEDLAGKDHAVISTGVTLVPGKVGHAFQFDGQGSQIDFGPEPGNFGADDFTMGFWVKGPGNPNDGGEDLISKRAICGYCCCMNVQIIRGPRGEPGQLICGLFDDRIPLMSGLSQVQSSSRVSDGQWHYVTWERRVDPGGATCSLLLFVDGQLDATAKNRVVSVVTTAAHMVLAQNVCIGADPTVPYTGAADSLAIWNHALSAEEVTEIYQASVAGKHPAGNGLTHFWSAEKSAIGPDAPPKPRPQIRPPRVVPAQPKVSPNQYL